MAKLMNPNTTIWLVDGAAVQSADEIDVDVLEAADNISCAIVTCSTLNPTDSDTDDTRSICDEGNVASTTYINNRRSLTSFRANNPDATPGHDAAMELSSQLFKHKGAAGYLVRRIGRKNNVPPAAGDLFSVFKFLSVNPQD